MGHRGSPQTLVDFGREQGFTSEDIVQEAGPPTVKRLYFAGRKFHRFCDFQFNRKIYFIEN